MCEHRVPDKAACWVLHLDRKWRPLSEHMAEVKLLVPSCRYYLNTQLCMSSAFAYRSHKHVIAFQSKTQKAHGKVKLLVTVDWNHSSHLFLIVSGSALMS